MRIGHSSSSVASCPKHSRIICFAFAPRPNGSLSLPVIVDLILVLEDLLHLRVRGRFSDDRRHNRTCNLHIQAVGLSYVAGPSRFPDFRLGFLAILNLKITVIETALRMPSPSRLLFNWMNSKIGVTTGCRLRYKCK